MNKEIVKSYIKIIQKGMKKIEEEMNGSFTPQDYQALLKSSKQHIDYVTKHFLNADGEVVSKVLTQDEIRDTKESIINYIDEKLTAKGKGEWRKYIEVFFDTQYKEFKIGTTGTGKTLFDKQTPEGSYCRYCFNMSRALIIEFFDEHQNNKFYNCIPNNKN